MSSRSSPHLSKKTQWPGDSLFVFHPCSVSKIRGFMKNQKKTDWLVQFTHSRRALAATPPCVSAHPPRGCRNLWTDTRLSASAATTSRIFVRTNIKLCPLCSKLKHLTPLRLDSSEQSVYFYSVHRVSKSSSHKNKPGHKHSRCFWAAVRGVHLLVVLESGVSLGPLPVEVPDRCGAVGCV